MQCIKKEEANEEIMAIYVLASHLICRRMVCLLEEMLTRWLRGFDVKATQQAKEVTPSCLSVVVKVYNEEARFCTKAIILIMNER